MRTIIIGLALTLLTGCLKDDPLNVVFQSYVPEEINDGLAVSTPEDEGMDADMLSQVYTDIYEKTELWSLRSMLVFRNGRLVAESYLKDDIYMTQPAFETPNDGHGEIDKIAGYPGAVHHLAGHDKKNHGHQRKHVQLAEYALGQHRQIAGVVAGNKGQHRRSTHYICQRRPGSQKQD